MTHIYSSVTRGIRYSSVGTSKSRPNMASSSYSLPLLFYGLDQARALLSSEFLTLNHLIEAHLFFYVCTYANTVHTGTLTGIVSACNSSNPLSTPVLPLTSDLRVIGLGLN